MSLEHIEYAVAYRAVNKPEYQIKTEITRQSSRLRPFGTEKGLEYPRSETNDKRERNDADCKEFDHYPLGKSRYLPAAFYPQRCDLAIERFAHSRTCDCNRYGQHGYCQTDLAGRIGAEMPRKI